MTTGRIQPKRIAENLQKANMEGGSLKSPYKWDDEAEGLWWQEIAKNAVGERAGWAGVSGDGMRHHLIDIFIKASV